MCAARDLNRLQHAFAGREPAEEEQVVVGGRTEAADAGVHRVMDDGDHGEAGEQPRLGVRDGHERRLAVVRPEGDLGRRRRVMQGLQNRNRRHPRVGQRHRVVLGLVVNEVEGGGPFHRRRQVEQLAQLPRPQGHVLVVALREERVQPGVGDRRGGREEGDVVAAGDQAVGEHGGDGFDRTGPLGGDRLRDRSDEGDAEAAALGEGTPCTGGHAQALSRNGGRTLDASKHSCAMSDARRAWAR